MGPLYGVPLSSVQSFFLSLSIYASPRWIPFLSVSNITKWERHYRAASRAITGCLSSSPIPFLLSEASLPPGTLTHFGLSSYKRALRLPTSFPISGLATLRVKPRLCRSSWRTFASSHPHILPSTSPRETLFAFPPSPLWNLFFFTLESIHSSPCSRFDLPLSLLKVQLSLILTLSHLTIWCFR